jgi:hypothetical protein
MGEIGELSRWVPAMAEAATRCGNLYSSVTLRCGFAVAWLARLEPGEIEDEITAALRSWNTPTGASQLQHLLALASRIDLAIYRGDPQSASDIVAADHGPRRRSLVDRTPMPRSLVLSSLARHALACASQATPDSLAQRDALATAKRNARHLRRVGLPLSDASWPVFSGAIAALERRDDDAAALWRAALPKLEALDYHLYAHATRYRLSELIGGTDGAAMRAVADDWLAAQGVREPATMMRMLLPSRDA